MDTTNIKFLLAAGCSLLFSTTSFAFTPAGGLWAIDSELNGSPGRGFQIEIENEVLILSYYGYRTDGSSVFYSAAGPIANNVFTGELMEYKNGKVLGGPFKPASSAGSAGTVKLTFTSGLSGTVTFPGESPLAISKYAFGYDNTPASLLGSWVFTYPIPGNGGITPNTDYYTLSKTGGATSNGSGTVFDASNNLFCENQIKGNLAGMIICAEATGTYPDSYLFKMSGDRGAGLGAYKGTSSVFPLTVIRTATGSGKNTAINDQTDASLSAKSSTLNTAAPLDPMQGITKFAETLPAEVMDTTVRIWVEEVRALMHNRTGGD